MTLTHLIKSFTLQAFVTAQALMPLPKDRNGAACRRVSEDEDHSFVCPGALGCHDGITACGSCTPEIAL